MDISEVKAGNRILYQRNTFGKRTFEATVQEISPSEEYIKLSDSGWLHRIDITIVEILKDYPPQPIGAMYKAVNDIFCLW